MTTLSRRSGRYFSRLIVPSDLRQVIGRREILRSLRCSTYRRAKLLGARWEGRLARLFILLRAHRHYMTKEQIEALVQHYLTTTLDVFEDFRLEKGRVCDEDLEGQWLVLSHLLDETVDQLTDHNYTKIGTIVDELLSAHGLAVPKTSPAYKKLCRSILAAQQQAFRIEMGRLDGDYTRGDGGSLRAGQTGAAGATHYASIFAPTPTITEAVKQYFEHYTHRDKRTNEEKERALQRFGETLPGKEATLLKDITKAHCIAFRNAYSQLPRRIPDKLRGKTIGEILTALKGTGYVKVTHSAVNHALTDLRHFFVWAIRHDHYTAGENPVEGIDFESVEEESNDPYTDADLKGIFRHPEFLDQQAARPERYWLLWVLLYTGARRSEIDQLDVADIRQDEAGTWFFDIRFHEEKGLRLKNKVSIRRTPVHSRLIAVGFLDYIESLQKVKQTVLFEKPAGSDKRDRGRSTVGDAVGKWFSRLKVSAKVSTGKTLHSFRHTVITRLTAAGVPQDMREMLVGHVAESTHGRTYTHREAISLVLLKEHLEKLRYNL